jgi:hypothetical protein
LVSHSSADDNYVAEMESFLRAAGFDEVFNDGSGIKPDERLWPKIEEGITDCESLVVVITAGVSVGIARGRPRGCRKTDQRLRLPPPR